MVAYMANAAEAAGDSNGHDGGGAIVGGAASGGRPPRLPRWTRQEILVLIQGKRVVESRGSRRRSSVGASPAAAVAGSPTEPKWASVSTYCRRHGVHRGPVQCRKRWSNLASDYKKIKEWEVKGKESFWAMRNDLRRDRRLPGFFDREVYDILEGTAVAAVPEEDGEEEEKVKDESLKVAAEVALFESGRTAAEDGLFSDFEEEKEAEDEDDEEETTPTAAASGALPPPVVAVPISEKRYEPTHQDQETSDQAAAKHTNPEKETPSSDGQKRRRTSEGGAEGTNPQSQLIEILDRNSRLLTAQLEAQNVNSQLDRDQRKAQVTAVLSILDKLADALGKIADKL